jgi:hypothetical protein
MPRSLKKCSHINSSTSPNKVISQTELETISLLPRIPQEGLQDLERLVVGRAVSCG